MKRRSFFKNGALAALGGLVLPSFDLQAQTLGEAHYEIGRASCRERV